MIDVELINQSDVVPFAEDDIYWDGLLAADELLTVCAVRMVNWEPDA